jgi:formate dehydrogenase maturation protein FdhE
MATEQIRYIEEDEIDLRELFKTIMKRKLFIVGFTSIITILAIVWAFTRTPIFEVKSNLQIGFIGKDLIAEPSTLIKTANLVFNVEDKPTSKKEFISEVSSITSNKKLKNFVIIKTQAISNDEALKKNKEVVNYIQNKYKKVIDQFINNNNNNNIKSVEVKIANLDNLEIKNIKRKIELLKMQDIIQIKERIKFLKDVKIISLKNKIKFNNAKLKEYIKSITQIYKDNKNTKDTTTLTISSMQIVNYQNLILNAQNKIEDLKVEIEKINNEIIPSLEIKKKNIEEDAIRKLKYKLKVELPNKRTRLLEQIEQLKYLNSEQNIQNSKVIGSYIVHDYPIKPKKKLIVIVAFVTGLILSIFLVFFLEFIGKEEDNKV